jgi:hypothetical protein
VLDEVTQVFRTVPLAIKLKVGLTVMKEITTKFLEGRSEQNICDYWFGHVVEPVLREKVTVDTKYYTSEDIKYIKHICDNSNISMLDPQAAFNYLLILRKYGKHDLDEAMKLFGDYPKTFWISVLHRVFDLELPVAHCLLNNRQTCTQAVMEYHRNYNLTLDFAQTLARFESPNDLDTVSVLKTLYSKPNFPTLMRVLDQSELHEIHLFQRATSAYIENSSAAVREQIKAQLSGAKLS